MGRPRKGEPQGDERRKVFWEWWWRNRRGEFLAWLRGPGHCVPKSAIHAYREAGGKIRSGA